MMGLFPPTAPPERCRGTQVEGARPTKRLGGVGARIDGLEMDERGETQGGGETVSLGRRRGSGTTVSQRDPAEDDRRDGAAEEDRVCGAAVDDGAAARLCTTGRWRWALYERRRGGIGCG
uniref:Uncharacterized protein n=1 Tax=Arundo donax TaxID=35708 RepID=A0A0A9DUY8_ARUDO